MLEYSCIGPRNVVINTVLSYNIMLKLPNKYLFMMKLGLSVLTCTLSLCSMLTEYTLQSVYYK